MRQHGHESSVKVPAGNGDVLRITYQHRYGKLPDGNETELRAVVNGKYESYFKPGASLKVRKDITDDPEKLTEVVQALAESLGAERFASIFEAEQMILPTKAFTERRYVELTDEQNAKLDGSGHQASSGVRSGKGGVEAPTYRPFAHTFYTKDIGHVDRKDGRKAGRRA